MEATVKRGFFKPQRFAQLLFRDFTSGYRTTLIAMAAIGGAIILIAALTALGLKFGGAPEQPTGEFYFGFFSNILFLGGFIVSSLAFKEAHRRGAGIFYMSIPASTFEKLTSKLLVTSLGYAIGTVVFITAVSALSEALVWLIFGFGLGFFNPMTLDVLYCLIGYVIGQSVFLLGSIWFKKAAFPKTFLWIVIFSIAAFAVALGLARILMPQAFDWNSWQAGSQTVSGASLNWSDEYLSGLFAPGTRAYTGCVAFMTIGKILFYGVLAPVCWLAAYFKLGETEV
jgi:hypothetical protein